MHLYCSFVSMSSIRAKQPQIIIQPSPCSMLEAIHCSRVCSLTHLASTCLREPKIPNFDSSVHNTCSNLLLSTSSVHVPILSAFVYSVCTTASALLQFVHEDRLVYWLLPANTDFFCDFRSSFSPASLAD